MRTTPRRSRAFLVASALAVSALIAGAAGIYAAAPAAAVPLTVCAATAPTDSNGATLNIAGRAGFAAHTGVPCLTEAQIVAGQTELTHVVGDLVITVDGTVVDKQWRDGCIAVRANNVTIKNSLVRTMHGCAGGDQQAAGSAINTGNAGVTGLLVQDSEVDAGNTDPNYDYIGVGAANYHLVRVNAHGGRHTLWAGAHVKIEDSFIHDPTNAAAPQHTEAIDADSGFDVGIGHSWISAATTPSTSSTGALFMGGHWAAPSTFWVNQTFLEGGQGADLVIDPGSSNTWFTGNHWSPNGYPTCYSVTGALYPENANGNYWSGSVWSETGAAVTLNC